MTSSEQQVEYNAETREALAQQIVDDWDMDTVMGYAVERLVESYESSQRLFEEVWKAENE